MPLTALKNIIKKLEQIDFVVAGQNAVIEGQEVLIEMLQGQLAEGLTGDNTPTLLYGSPFYHFSTIFRKEKYGVGIGAITSHITLFMFGDFYSQMTMKISKGKFTIFSNVPYYDKIIERSGESIMRVSAANMESFYQLYIKPALDKEIDKILE